jgi:archaellum component FlaF (FlaF/FlaG flagellin family)
MGFSLSASFAIIGATVLVAIELFTGAVIPDTMDIADAFQLRLDHDIKTSQTKINISGVTVTLNGTNYDFQINLTNTGGQPICLFECQLLIDGVVTPFNSDDSYLLPLNTTRIDLENIQSTGQGRIKIVTAKDCPAYHQYQV